MIITLTNDELNAAVKAYLGDDYVVSNVNFVISRKAGTSTKAEVTATRPEISNTIDVGLDEEEPEQIGPSGSLFPGGN